MRVLLDHCIDWRLKRSLPNHEVKSTGEMGWEDLRNGELLAKASSTFEASITVDKNLKHQQNLSKLPLTVVELECRDIRLKTLIGLSPRIEEALSQIQNGARFVVVHLEGSNEILA